MQQNHLTNGHVFVTVKHITIEIFIVQSRKVRNPAAAVKFMCGSHKKYRKKVKKGAGYEKSECNQG